MDFLGKEASRGKFIDILGEGIGLPLSSIYFKGSAMFFHKASMSDRKFFLLRVLSPGTGIRLFIDEIQGNTRLR